MGLQRQLETLMRALAADDPVAVLCAADPELARAVEPEGFRLASLLVRKLRFERIMTADAVAREKFEQDPESFTRLFSEYHRSEPPKHAFPAEEARAFQEFVARRSPP